MYLFPSLIIVTISFLGFCKTTLFDTLFVCLSLLVLSPPDRLDHMASARLEGCHFFFFLFSPLTLSRDPLGQIYGE